nr:beta-galactosidase domain 4-containing protein [Pontibacter vulgaris]
MYTHFWTAETPNLLQVGHLQTSARYRIQEVVSHKIGVRVVEEKQGKLLVNGVPVKLNPVAFQHSSLSEKPASREELEAFIIRLKQHNVNTLVVTGLPVNEDLYELADTYGLYVIQKVEPSAASAADPQLWLLQQTSMVYRIRNHPSLLAWQLGNSTRKTEKEMLQAFADSLGNASSYRPHDLDPYRPVLFSSPLGMPKPVAGFDNLSDEAKKQLKQQYQPLHIFLQDTTAGKIVIRNLQGFAPLTNLGLDWEISDSTTILKQGSIQDIQLTPQRAQTIQLPLNGKEYLKSGKCLRISVRLGKESAWASQGHEVAWKTFCL